MSDQSDSGSNQLGITYFRFLRPDTIEDICPELREFMFVQRGLTSELCRTLGLADVRLAVEVARRVPQDPTG